MWDQISKENWMTYLTKLYKNEEIEEENLKNTRNKK